MIEDVVFNVQAVKNIQSINILSDILYHYRIRDNGNLTSKYLENYFESMAVDENLSVAQMTEMTEGFS